MWAWQHEISPQSVLFLLSSQKSTFSPLAEKLCIGSKSDWHLLDGLQELYRHAKLGKIVQRAPAVGLEIWSLCVFLSLTLGGRRAVHSRGT